MPRLSEAVYTATGERTRARTGDATRSGLVRECERPIPSRVEMGKRLRGRSARLMPEGLVTRRPFAVQRAVSSKRKRQVERKITGRTGL